MNSKSTDKLHQERILSQLLNLAEQLGAEIREEKGDFNGGWCIVDGEQYLFLNRKHDTPQKISVLAKAIAEQPLEGIFILPAIRQILERYYPVPSELDESP